MDFELKFNMDNDCFTENEPQMVAGRIINEVASQMFDGIKNGVIRDPNGNTVGQWEIKED